ncbi:hypothetical protein V2J09_021312 [Rumex salicifolius]
MEKLKAAIPEKLKKMISESSVDNLPSCSSSLHDFVQLLPLFHHTIDNLTNPELKLCGKKKEAALELKRRGNDCFSAADYYQASIFYSQALRMAPMDVIEKQNYLVPTLYVNRASCFHKIGLMQECLGDCDRALIICPRYTKAWYRRGKANTSMNNYKDAVCDLKIAMLMEQSCSGKRQIKHELELIVKQATKTDFIIVQINEENLCTADEKLKVKIHCVHTPTKGRGMASQVDISEASVVHKEEPYAAIILKSCRETHCHFCFNELRADIVPCTSCSLSLYCSQNCQTHAGGNSSTIHLKNERDIDVVPSDLRKYFSDVCLADDSRENIEYFAEHRHECHGFHWPTVLPSDVVLAGRILVKSMELKGHMNDSSSVTDLDLLHNYDKLPVESRLESFIYSIVLLYCLQICYDSKYELNGGAISKVVLLICQIKVNSMAVVRMKSGETSYPLVHSEKSSSHTELSLSSIEQVRVGQAIYSIGSMFNHSCQPNIHAYFFCRTLFIRSTEFVAEGFPLELSYGPQVGQWDCGYRQRFLEEKYFFRCHCCGCSQLNLPDLVINSFQCAKPHCLGAILDSLVVESEKHKVDQIFGGPIICSSESKFQVDMFEGDDLNNIAGLVFHRRDHRINFETGCCLTCGNSYNLENLHASVEEAEAKIKNLQSLVALKKVDYTAILGTMPSLQILKSKYHSYNKKTAKAEDVIAEAFCLIGELKLAAYHCMESVKILKKLYSPKHIVVGNELVKLASIQLSLANSPTLDTITQVDAIFSKRIFTNLPSNVLTTENEQVVHVSEI